MLLKAQTAGRIPPMAVDTGSGRVQVSPISRLESHELHTAISVETAQSEETMPCSERTPHSDIPTGYVVHWLRHLSVLAPNGICQCPLHQSRARPARDPL